MAEYVRDYGIYAAFRGISADLGLDKLVRKHFPEDADEILTIAQYMFSEGNTLSDVLVYLTGEGLKPFEYFTYVLEQLLLHAHDEVSSYISDLVPWSEKIPDRCRKLNT